MTDVTIARPSFMSLPVSVVRPRGDGKGDEFEFGLATCFVVRSGTSHYLVTNRHVVSNRHPKTGESYGPWAALPTILRVAQNASTGIGEWKVIDYELYDRDGNAKWLIHPELDSTDVVVLPLETKDDSVQLMPYSLELATDQDQIYKGPTAEVSVIGFPFGEASAGAMGIWTRGTVASEPDLDYDGRPVFLIDARTQHGQSGSPVLSFSNKPWLVTPEGKVKPTKPGRYELLGVYSGRIDEQSDIGLVWKVQTIRDIIAGGKLSPLTADHI
jgi:S1-C subfamily serine protease